MLKNPAKIEALFRDTLLSDEEIYWLGAPLHNFWHFKGRYFFYILGIFLMISLIALGIYVFVVGLAVGQWLITVVNYNLMFLLIYFGVFFARLLFQIIQAKEGNRLQMPVQASLDVPKSSAWWKPSYYAITNMRVLIFEQGNIRDYWYHLLDMPILKKPKNRAASIQLYSSTYAAKKKKTPVLDTLRGIPENEVDDAFAILKQARAEALEERKQKMGRG